MEKIGGRIVCVGLIALMGLGGCGGQAELFEQGGGQRLMAEGGKADAIPYGLCFDSEQGLVYNLLVIDEPVPWGVKATVALGEDSTSNVKIKIEPSVSVNTSDWEHVFLPMQEVITPGDQKRLYTWLGFSDRALQTENRAPKLFVSLYKSTGLTQIYGELTEGQPACVDLDVEVRYCGPEVVADPAHPDCGFCREVAAHSRQAMTEYYAEELVTRFDP